MDGFGRFKEKELPLKNEFYSKLSDERISITDYKHAQTIWTTFNCKTMADYHDLYLKTDVLILADVFETFRNTCREYYNLDSVHYFSSPGFA